MTDQPKCPYCDQVFDTSDGPFADDEEYEIECSGCEKWIIVISNIYTHWKIQCNKGDHDFKTNKYSRNSHYFECTRCDAYYFDDMKSSIEKVFI